MVFSQMPVLSTSTPPGSPVGLPASPSFRSPSILDSPLTPRRHPRESSFGASPLRSPPDLGPDHMAVDEDISEPEVVEPRLVIKKLVLINYKSYAGRQEIGPFNENFTAIVGPNGSGKSNVIDSLLFAFGFRAKKMRQEKLTGLIHKSETHPNLSFARVEVHFETKGIPDSELRLAREVRRDGSNFYALNESRASYAEISNLLEQRGIDLRHKRFLILQGEVESISLMPPKADNNGDDGLLEYLEDIIGTANYKVRIEELDAEKERLRGEASEKQTRADIVHKDVKKLDNDRAQMERFMINQNRGTVARSNLYQLQIHRLQNALNLSQTGIDEKKAEIVGIQQKLRESQTHLDTLHRSNSEANPQVLEWKKEIKDLSAKLKDAKLKEVKFNQQREQMAKRLKKAERELSHAATEKSQSEQWLSNFDGDSKKLEEKISEIVTTKANELKILDEMHSELQESTKGLQEDSQKLQAQAEPWRAQISQKRQEIESIEAQINNMHKELDEFHAKEHEITAQAEQLGQDGKSTRRLVNNLAQNHSKLVNEHENLAKEILELKASRENALQKVEQIRPDVAAAQENRASSQSQNRIENQLLKLKIPGLYGRLGSLGSIDQKYDIAVSTAGPELNNFVVDNPETAKRCIDALRKHSIGRARFMALDKLRNPSQVDPSRFPATRIFDLVKPVDPLFLKAFYSALGDTLVVDTPDDARRTAFDGQRRHKVVTLGGMLVSSSGTMSGGGSPSRGFMAKTVSTISSEELENLEKVLADVEMEYADIRQQLASAQAREEELTAEIPRAKMELDREEMSLKQQESNFTEVKERRRAIKAEIALLSQKCEQVDAESKPRILALEKEQTSIEEASRPIEDQIRALQEQILNAGGLSFRNQKRKVTELEDRESDIRRQLKEGQENVARELSKIKKLNNDIKRYESEIEECSRNNKPQAVQDSSQIHQIEAEIQRVSVELQHNSNEIEAAKARAAEVLTEMDELRATEIEIDNSLKKMMQAFAEKTRRLKDIQAKHSGLKLHDVSIARNLASSADAVADRNHDIRTTDSMPQIREENDLEVKQEQELSNFRDSDVSQIVELSPDEIDGLDEEALKRDISNSDRACESQSIDMKVLERYQQKFQEYQERKALSDEAVSSYESAKDELQSLTRRRFNEFMDGFRQISAKLKELYQLITMGGNAELELVDSMDPFAEGILFSVMPPKKSWRNIANLSGGEKTLSSLALVFALHHYKPTPLYVMDEIDAALDFRNVSIIANYIKERTRDGQFIVISLRNNMFELASRLVGVYKVDNMTRSVALQTE